MNDEKAELEARIEQLEIQVERLVEVTRDLNSYIGNPLGIMDADFEIGPLFEPRADENGN